MKKEEKPQLMNKIYRITLGTYDKEGEYYNADSTIVKATDVWDALRIAGDWILKKEKENKTLGEETFVESVEYLETIEIEE